MVSLISQHIITRSYTLTLRLIKRPLSASVKEAEELTRVAKKNGVRTMVGLQGR